MAEQLSVLLTAGNAMAAVERAGGTLAIHVERGDRVAVAILSKLAKRPDVEPEEAKAKVQAALGILGVTEVYFMDVDDDALQLRTEHSLQMADIVRQVRPDVIITHHPWEGFGYGVGVEGVTSLCTTQAMIVAYTVDPGSKYLPTNLPAQIFWFATLSQYRWTAMNDLYYDVYVDISEVAQRKVQALREIREIEAKAYAVKYVEALDGLMGLTAHTGYAEGFMRTFREVCDSLPISDLMHARHLTGETEMWARMSQFHAYLAP